MREKRRYPRVKLNLPITIRYHGILVPANSVNVSCGGMCLATDNPEVIGDDDVEIIFDLSKSEPDVSVRGKVVRIEPGMTKNVGVQFTNFESVGYKILKRYIENSN